MSAELEKRLLQLVVAIAAVVPLAMGLMSIIQGPAILKGVGMPAPTDLDSHFRYLSGLLLGIGLAFVGCIPGIERKTILFRALSLIVIVGGLGRLTSLLSVGAPSEGHQFGFAMELGVVPLIMFWQTRVARRFPA